MSAAADVVVIGAGMLGAAAAYRLARAGLRVVVREANTVAGGATGNSFSWLNAVDKEPEAYHRLNAAGVVEYDRLEAELGRTLVRRGGCLEWAVGDRAGALLAEKVARLEGRGYTVRWLSRAELTALEPGLRPAADVERTAWYPHDGWVDAPAVAAALLDDARAHGAAVQERDPVTGLRAAGGGRVAAVAGAHGALPAGAVLICAGTGTPALTGALGVRISLLPRPGLLAVTRPVAPGTLGRTVYAPGVHLRPDVAGGIRIGADAVDARIPTETAVPPSGPSLAAPLRALGTELIDRAAAVLPALRDVALDRVLVGYRPYPADGHTVAGRLPGWENVYVAVTHSGITLGPLLGRLLAEEIATGRRHPLLAPFGPERLAGRA
jgi:glycine/D-amino acid oxidase-like deaminating enzyme